MSGIGVLALFVIASGADGIVERFGWLALFIAVAVCGAMVLWGERYD